MRSAPRILLPALFLLLLAPAVRAQSDIDRMLVPDAPSALFSAQLGDADVDLFIDGSWRTGIGGTLGWAFHPAIPPDGRRVTFPYAFPSMQRRPFYNIVDLTISLWLYERFFFETTFINDFEFNTVLLGYQGQEGEFVQSVRVGNAGLSISPYPYIDFNESLENSPGASAEFRSDTTLHELLLRYEPSSTDRRRFFGMNELDERRIEPSAFIRGRFFVLPDQNVEDLQLFRESADGSFSGGDGRLYERINLDAEAVFSTSEGFVFLRRPATGRVLVFYSVGGVPVGSSGLGVDALIGEADRPGEEFLLNVSGRINFEFADVDYYGINLLEDLRVTLTGGPGAALLLYQPGRFSPFELQNRYDVSGFNLQRDTDLTTALVLRESSRERSLSGSSLSLGEERRELIVGDKSVDLRHPANRYPFAIATPTFPRLYGPNRTTEAGYTDFQILTRALRPVNAISIGPGAIPGSVSVTRNGRPDNSFTVNYSTGELSTSFPVAPNDVIDVSYRSYLSDGSGGDLLFASGNRIRLNDTFDLQLAFGIRWNVLGNTYSITPDDHPGAITASARLDWNRPNFQGFLDGAVQLTNPDTTGILRLLGMEERETRIPAAEFAMFPSAPPEGDDLPAPLATLTQGNRGKLFFRDYFTEAGVFSGGGLREYTASLPASRIFPYADGSRIGPYPARADADGIDGNVMVMDYELDGDDWVGAQLRVPGGRRDFSDATGITFRWRALESLDATDPTAVGNPNDVRVYLQIGATDEDLDGDGVLDEGSSPLLPSFLFNHPSVGTLRAGTVAPGRTLVLSEDGTGNGVLDREVPELVFTSRELRLETPGLNGADPFPSGWQTAEISLSAEQRRRLAETRAIRVIVVRNGTATAGRLLFGDFRVQGARPAVASTADPTDSGNPDPVPPPLVPPNVNVREVTDRPPGGVARLIDQYPEVRDVFHPESRDAQRVLRISWGDPPLTDPQWKIVDYVTPVPFRRYDKLIFYLRVAPPLTESGGDPVLTVSLTDEAGDGARGIFAEIPLPDAETLLGSRWRRVELDVASRSVTIDGVDLPPGAQITVDPPAAGRDLTRLSIGMGNTSAGEIYLDEVHWADSRITLEGTSRLALSWQRPDTIWRWGSVDVVRDMKLDHDMSVRSAGFTTDAAAGTGAGLYSSATALRSTIVGARVETDFSMAVSEETTTFTGGHALRIPAAASPVVLLESYRRSYRSPVSSLFRSNALILTGEDLGVARVDANARLRGENLSQTWRIRLESSWSDNPSVFTQMTFIHSSGGFQLSDDLDYASSWISGYQLLAPNVEGSGIARDTRSETRLRFDYDRASVQVEPNWDIQNQSATRGTQRNRGSLALSTPLRFGGPGFRAWSLTPAYSRAAAFTTVAPDHDSYRDDIAAFWSAFGEQRYFFTSPPFYELLAPADDLLFASDTAGLSSARYDPEASLTYQRNFGSTIRDLFVPHRVRTALRRSLVRDADAVTDTVTWQLDLTSAAVNLFGSLGAYQLVTFYQSDEFRNSIDFRIQDRRTDGTYQIDTQILSESAFFGRRNRSLAIDHAVGISAPEDTQIDVESVVAFRRRNEPASIFGIEALQPAIDRGAYYQHSERLTVTALQFREDRWRNEITVLLGHETSLELPDQGSVRAYFDLGLGWKPFDLDAVRERMFILGIQAGIEGRIQF
ncbi:MAG: hypothetical protein EA403_07900 [Spirochaetaceae bacterium]|nr:MAG: hypothetical protein EA403_07900 [Spirochaetaceae bacterium]